MDGFWAVIQTQLAELRVAASAEDVFRILSHERNPYQGGACGGAKGFFAGSGGDVTVREVLLEAGWTVECGPSAIFYAMRSPKGDVITYCEGDIYSGFWGGVRRN